jgi:hypothetical protein
VKDSFIDGVEEKPVKGKAARFSSPVETITPAEAAAVKRGQKPPDKSITHKNYTIRDVPIDWIQRIDRIADEMGLTKKDAGLALLHMALQAYDDGQRPLVRARPRAKNVLVLEI